MNPTNLTGDARPAALTVFVRATGQADNIGDSILRRGLTRSLRTLGPLHVLVRGLPPSYVDGLDLQPDDTIYTDERAWLRSAWTACRHGAVVFALNAGEFQFSRTYAVQYLSYLPVILRSRRSGGFSAQLGAGLRSVGSRWRWVIAPVVRAISTVVWRDDESRAALGVGTVMPDWAFDEGSSDGWLVGEGTRRARPTLAVSMRGDRPFPSSAWFDAVRALASRDQLTPVLVVQVASDAERATEIAAELNAQVVPLQGTLHREQEERVRAIYRDSSAVVSDRLHALILASTEGAIPVGLVDGGSGKVARHFRSAGMDDVVIDSASMPLATIVQRVNLGEQTRRDVVRDVVAARARIEGVTSSLGSVARRRAALPSVGAGDG